VKRIGIISDTHGLLRPEAEDALGGSELIIHAGDVGDAAILDALARIAPVHAVRGNMDRGALARSLPATTVVDLGAGGVWAGEERESGRGREGGRGYGGGGGIEGGGARERSRGGGEGGDEGDDGRERSRGDGGCDDDEASPGTLAYVLHDLSTLDLDPAAAGFRLVVHGHTHRPTVEEKEGVLYLNPGSAGPRRFSLPISLAILSLVEEAHGPEAAAGARGRPATGTPERSAPGTGGRTASDTPRLHVEIVTLDV